MKCSNAWPSRGTRLASRSAIATLLEVALDLIALLVGDVSIEGGEHQRLPRTGKNLRDQLAKQIGLQRTLRVGCGVHVRPLAFVADQQALAVHHLHQAQGGRVGEFRALAHAYGVDVLNRRRTKAPNDPKQVEL